MNTTMRCDQFDELLADFMDGSAGAQEHASAEAHLRSCVRCSGLLAELKSIQTEAAQLPALTPSRDLWSGIAARIEAPVVDIGGRPPVTVAPARINRAWLAAAAVTLMAVSSGTTYMVAGNRAPADSARAVAVAPEVPVVSRPEADAPPEVVRTPNVELPAARSAGQGVVAVARPLAPAAPPSLEQTYEKEVVALRRILTERSDALDPKTVAILEESIKMIDQAILQSRQALAADPASGFLRDQLNKALDRKVEVLRTAAMLPART